MMVQISINGESRTFASEMTVEELLRQLEKNPKFLAVEVNHELVPRRIHRDYTLKAGDQVEIVTLVGGG